MDTAVSQYWRCYKCNRRYIRVNNTPPKELVQVLVDGQFGVLCKEHVSNVFGAQCRVCGSSKASWYGIPFHEHLCEVCYWWSYNIWYSTSKASPKNPLPCDNRLIWVCGKDGFEAECSKCGKVYLGLLDNPDKYPTCAAVRRDNGNG